VIFWLPEEFAFSLEIIPARQHRAVFIVDGELLLRERADETGRLRRPTVLLEEPKEFSFALLDFT
jgi:hypothetical protein